MTTEPPSSNPGHGMRSSGEGGQSSTSHCASTPELDHSPTSAEFLALASASYDAYYSFDQHKGYNAFGPQLDAMLGLAPFEFDRSYAAAIERIHPEDRRRVDLLVDESFRTGKPYVDKYRMRHESGAFIHVSDRGVIVEQEPGLPRRMIGMIRDITPEITAERLTRETEELYTSLFRHVGNPLLQLDAEGVCTDANAAAEAFLGNPKSKLTGTLLQNILGPHNDSVIQHLLDGAKAGRVDRSGQIDLRLEGANRHALVTIVPSELRGEPVFFLVATDITQLRQMGEVIAHNEARLRQQAAALEARNTALAVLLDQRQEERLDLEREVAKNVQRFLLPLIEHLRDAVGSRPEQVHVDALWRTTCDILRPVASNLDRAVAPTGLSLTRREMEVLNLVRLGKTTKEIAAALYLSTATVTAHRRSIRRKLGLTQSGVHLSSHLAGLGEDEGAVTARSSDRGF